MSTEVYTTSETDRRLWALIRAVKTEIGGWGYAFQQPDGSFTWDQVFLVPQYASSSEVDFEGTDGDVVAIEKAIADGVLDDPAFCWVSWHSHHTMKAFWSSTDDKRIAAMSKAGVKKLLSFVGCHDGDYEMRLDVFDVKAHGINIGQVTVSDVKLFADTDVDDDIAVEIKANLLQRPKTVNQQWNAASVKKVEPKRFDLNTAFAIRDLMDEGFTHAEALTYIEGHGLEEVEALLAAGGDIVAPWELAGYDELAAVIVGDDG